MSTLKKVAILGRPNVGKSSLFNRLARERDAITSDMSGTTRDIKKRIVTISKNRDFEILDPGGIDYSSELFSKVAAQSLKAAKQADIIIYMVNGKSIPEEEDRELFYQLQALNRITSYNVCYTKLLRNTKNISEKGYLNRR